MKQSVFILFVSFVLVVYSLVNYYLFVKGYRALPDEAVYKNVYIILFLFFSIQFVISRILLLTDAPWQPRFVFELGGIWFAAVMYFFIIALFIDVLRVTDHFVPFLSSFYPYKFKLLLSVVGVVFFMLIIGYSNAHTPVLKTLNLKIDKRSSIKRLKIAMVSDVHFGTIIGYSEIEKMLKIIKNEGPDVFLIVGDLIDEGATKSKIEEIKPLFDDVQPKYGKLAVLGNHEYINKIERALPIFQQLGITLLRDSAINFADDFVIVGRDDKSRKSVVGTDRKSLKYLLKDINSSLPILLLDHQPYSLNETAKFPIDLQLSGHTHDGQMFPINLLTKSTFEMSWGYLKKGNTHIYVSSGFGTWGPRVRIGNTPEIVIVNLIFEN